MSKGISDAKTRYIYVIHKCGCTVELYNINGYTLSQENKAIKEAREVLCPKCEEKRLSRQ